jgi:copper chaperone CopZ
MIYRITDTTKPLLTIALSPIKNSSKTLRDIRLLAENHITDALLNVDGVADVDVFGANIPEIQIKIRKDALDANNVSAIELDFSQLAEEFPEILDEYEKLHRIDRLVFTEEELVILEFKLGGRQQAHREQVRRYRRLIQAAYGEDPRGFLFYLEEPALVEVSKPTQLSLF